MYLIVDTETNGLGSGGGSSVSARRAPPRVLELAYLLVSGDGRLACADSTLIVPDGFRISRAAQAVHGITPLIAAQQGVPAEEALARFFAAVRRSKVIVAHNVRFDLEAIAAEAERCDLSSRDLLRPWYCTMRGGASVCRDQDGSRSAWPTLERLHTVLFGTGLSMRHRALPDAEACGRCFFEMRRMRQLDRRGLIWHHYSTASSLRGQGS